eukprot:m.299226 g.299226  ORF g.299226 m.299226 type:complete len:91 (-) comp20106_c0_seq2:1469-1741(-)
MPRPLGTPLKLSAAKSNTCASERYPEQRESPRARFRLRLLLPKASNVEHPRADLNAHAHHVRHQALPHVHGQLLWCRCSVLRKLRRLLLG